MKQLAVLSGKGGTGKTTVAAALIKLSQAKAYADCDIDAPNLKLITENGGNSTDKEFYGFKKAHIEVSKCKLCGKCEKNCRFGAIKKDGQLYFADSMLCEGCGVCRYICPEDAITMENDAAATLMLYKGDKVFSAAELKTGSGTTGKLVTAVKQRLISEADSSFAVIDGSPGVGCPVIATISGADAVLIVSEPTVSGISDLKRIAETAEKFDVFIMVCVNKYDINNRLTDKIEEFCKDSGIVFLGKIPYDKTAAKAVNRGKCIIDYSCKASKAVKVIYQEMQKYFSL